MASLNTVWSKRIRRGGQAFLNAKLMETGDFRTKLLKELKTRIFRDPSPLCTVLDVGCGTAWAYHFLLHVIEYVGIDFTAEYRQTRWFPNHRFFVADAHHLPFKTNTFDMVFECVALQYCVNWRDVIAEMVRVAQSVVIILSELNNGPTIQIPAEPKTRWAFDHRDIITTLSKYGRVMKWGRVKDPQDKKRLGMFVCELN